MFEGFEEGHCFFYGTVFVLIVEDMESIRRLWVVTCYLHILVTTDQENHQDLQAHQHKNCLEVQQHNFTTFQTYQLNNSPPPPTPYDRCGIYALICVTCNKAYVGQTSRSLKQSYKEHTRYIKSNNPQSAYVLHILKNLHDYGPKEKNDSFKRTDCSA